jgi:hypothetical protein
MFKLFKFCAPRRDSICFKGNKRACPAAMLPGLPLKSFKALSAL